MQKPFLSVITPFRNTAAYLAECIESVLAQGYENFEYILSDNCSTDGSTEIAESYAKKDSRIRLVRQVEPLSQVGHYNRALLHISADSQYCKIVQADDYIFPECLHLMVQVFRRSEAIGIVSSYDLKDNIVRGSGYPYPAPQLPGREVAKWLLRGGAFIFGSPNTVMYRSSLVREQIPFFDESLLHEDTEKCMQVLNEWDFGFVHQVLSFMRVDNTNESISEGVRAFNPDLLDRYIIVQRYAPEYLEAAESETLRNDVKRSYYDFLAKEYLRRRTPAFWQYHVDGLKTLGEKLDQAYLACRIFLSIAMLVTNPGNTFSSLLQMSKKKTARKRETQSEGSLEAKVIATP
jgi:glycosyltransferase involved in cell wall biosynthesis